MSHTVSLVTGDGCDAVDWDEPTYQRALDSLAETARQHADNVNRPVFVSDPVDGHGVLYTTTDHHPAAPIRTEFRYCIQPAATE